MVSGFSFGFAGDEFDDDPNDSTAQPATSPQPPQSDIGPSLKPKILEVKQLVS